MTTRPAAVAGMFYPQSAPTLRAEVASLLEDKTGRRTAGVPRALIVPHAGYVYSGPVAASAYRLLAAAAGKVRRVVILGPAHRVYIRGIAVPTVDEFATPIGSVPIDRAAVDALQRFPWVVRSDEAHALEHCIEVQLPFLQSVLGAFELVPLVVGECGGEQVREVIEALWIDAERDAEGAGAQPRTLVIVSSDLSHYLPYAEATRVDAQTSAVISSCAGDLDGEQACGAHAINGLMRVARAQGLRVEALDLRNSGDTAGDRSQVVGYGAYALY